MIPGTPDLIQIIGHDLLVIDFKFGYTLVERAELNLQLRTYAVIAYVEAKRKPHKVYVAIAQPRASFNECVTIACYTPEDIQDAIKQIEAIDAASQKPDAPLVAGEEQCRHCKAKMICTAFRDAMSVSFVGPETIDIHALSKTKREAYLEQRIAELTDEQLGKMHDAIKLSALVKEPTNDEIRKRISAGGMTDYELGRETKVREISDVRRAIGLLSLYGMKESDIYDCVTKMPIGNVEEKVREMNPTLKTWKDANDWINKHLARVITTETRKPRIVRKHGL